MNTDTNRVSVEKKSTISTSYYAKKLQIELGCADRENFDALHQRLISDLSSWDGMKVTSEPGENPDAPSEVVKFEMEPPVPNLSTGLIFSMWYESTTGNVTLAFEGSLHAHSFYTFLNITFESM